MNYTAVLGIDVKLNCSDSIIKMFVWLYLDSCGKNKNCFVFFVSSPLEATAMLADPR